jgi:hypothetical protein
MDEIIYMGYDPDAKKVRFVTDQGEVVEISNCDCDTEPIPDPLPEAYDIIWDAYVKDGGSYSKINERFEILEGRCENRTITFHFKSLADKLSMQGGVLVMGPTNLIEHTISNPLGSGTIKSPRKPEFPQRSVEVRWETRGLYFIVDGKAVQGSATSSEGDHPWNLHYGIEIAGSISL